jgi:FixJ family two-component response regulator
MPSTEPKPAVATVFVVDDDQAVANSLKALIESVHLRTAVFPTAQAFLERYDPREPGCLVLDLRMPGMSGLQLQETLAAQGIVIPIIFITGHGDVKMAVRALKAGAVDFLEKPFHDQDLLDRIQQALLRDQQWRRGAETRAVVQKRIDTLTPREREVMDLLAQGKPTKAIAAALNLSGKTVEFHRAKVMEKMQTRSSIELIALLRGDRSAGDTRETSSPPHLRQ